MVRVAVLLSVLCVMLLLRLVAGQLGVQLGGRQVVAVPLPHYLGRIAPSLHGDACGGCKGPYEAPNSASANRRLAAGALGTWAAGRSDKVISRKR